MNKITSPGDYQLIKYTTGNLASRFGIKAEDMRNCFALSVDWQGFPNSFALDQSFFASAQSYWDGIPYGSTNKFFRNQKWAIFKKLVDSTPTEAGAAFIGEMVAKGTSNFEDRYLVRRLDFTFLRAYRDELKTPFRKAATLAKLKWDQS